MQNRWFCFWLKSRSDTAHATTHIRHRLLADRDPRRSLAPSGGSHSIFLSPMPTSMLSSRQAPRRRADEETGARALTTHEVHRLRDDFITAAQRAAEAGYDGVEIHGAHGYICVKALSPQYNRRTDAYGGSLANRWRLVLEILEGVRSACGSSFLIGLESLSPSASGMQPERMRRLVSTRH